MVHPDQSWVVRPHAVPIPLDERLKKHPRSHRRRPVPVGRGLDVFSAAAAAAAVSIFRGPEGQECKPIGFIRGVCVSFLSGGRGERGEGAEERAEVDVNVVEIDYSFHGRGEVNQAQAG